FWSRIRMTRQSKADNAGLMSKAIAPTIFGTDMLHTKSHETFHGLDRGQRLIHEQRFSVLPYLNLTVRKKCHHRREQRITSLCVRDHSRCLAINKSDQTVGRSQINTNYAFHNASLSLSTSRD